MLRNTFVVREAYASTGRMLAGEEWYLSGVEFTPSGGIKYRFSPSLMDAFDCETEQDTARILTQLRRYCTGPGSPYRYRAIGIVSIVAE